MDATGCELARTESFAAWMVSIEPRLRSALVAAYGPVDGREATVDALSWAWENWSRVAEMTNPIAYLYRVGQSASRRFATRSPRLDESSDRSYQMESIDSTLMAALGRLPVQQRTVVLLVHGLQWRQREVADLLEVSPSTVHEHLRRAIRRLREELGDDYIRT